ncbi:MAG: hypothetical protein Tsb0021_07740 [Chlamydiales bacterium]
MKFRPFIILVLLLLAVGALWYRSEILESHTEVRAALDIGSGTTNIKIARVNPEANKIIQYLFEERVPVPFQKELSLSPNNTFGPHIQEEGIKAFNYLKNIADDYQAKKVVAIATAAFRHAANANTYAEEIHNKTGIDVEIISQEQEGILSFLGAIAKSTTDPKRTIVWDIGGGSFQLTTMEKDGDFFVERGTKASIHFKNYMIEKVKEQNLQKVHSPNPLTRQQIEQGIAYGREMGENMSDRIKGLIHRGDTSLFAVGNLFYYGIRPLVGGKDTFTRQDLEKAVLNLANKTDEDVGGGPLAEVAISNAIMVLGVMEGLGIEQVTLLDVNNADGALLYTPYWE